MNKIMKSFAVAVALAVPAAVLTVVSVAPSGATESSYKFRQVQDLRKMLANIFNVTTGHDHDGVNSKLPSVPYPAAQTIGAAGTVALDACGGVKRITSAANVTSSTTYTFASTATASNLPCAMDVVNTGQFDITLDSNGSFMTMGDQNIVLKSTRAVRVDCLASVGCTHGGYWTTY